MHCLLAHFYTFFTSGISQTSDPQALEASVEAARSGERLQQDPSLESTKLLQNWLVASNSKACPELVDVTFNPKCRLDMNTKYLNMHAVYWLKPPSMRSRQDPLGLGDFDFDVKDPPFENLYRSETLQLCMAFRI